MFNLISKQALRLALSRIHDVMIEGKFSTCAYAGHVKSLARVHVDTDQL
jgi:hypothetical protein